MGWNAAIKTVLGHEREMLARFLELLGKVNAEKEYAERGYSSLNEYCLKELGLCEHETWPRISAARLAMKHPPRAGVDRRGTGDLDRGQAHRASAVGHGR